MRVRPYDDHIPLQRLWAFSVLDDDRLTADQQSHVFECDKCSGVLLACMRATTFSQALDLLDNPDQDDNLAQAS